MAGYAIKQNQTTQPLMFLMVDGTDHITGKTGLSPTVTLSKNGASFASPSGAVSEVGSGWYKVAGNATDANTLGQLKLHATATGADPCDESYAVVAYDPLSATNLGLSDITAIKAATDNLPSDPADASDIAAAFSLLTSAIGSPQQADTAVTLPSIPSGWITAAGIAADALDGKGDWLTAAGYTTPPTAATIADAVWDEAQSGHTTAGTFGSYLDAAVSGVSTGGVSAADIATAVWQDATAGDFTVSGSVGKLVKDNLNAPVGSIPTNPLTSLGTHAPAGWLNYAAIDIPLLQSITHRIDLAGTTSPATEDTYVISGFYGGYSYYTSTTLGTPMYLWRNAGIWTLSTTTPGTALPAAYFQRSNAGGATGLSGNYTAQGTATGFGVLSVSGGDWLAKEQESTIFAALTVTNGITANITGNISGSVGSVTGGATAANQTTILNRLGSFTGTGVNTVLGFFKALLSKAATTPSDVGGTFDPANDSTEALRERGDAAWVTATGFSTLDAAGVRTAVGLGAANLDTQLGAISAKTTNLPSDPADASDVAAALADLQSHGDATWATATGFSTFDPATDTVLLDVTTQGAPGYVIAHQLRGAFTTATSSVFTVSALANAPAGGGGGGSDPYVQARIYGAVTANADGSLDFKDVTDTSTTRVRIGPTSPVGGRTVTLDP